MALTDEIREYIARFGTPKTEITEKHSVAIAGEIHKPIFNDAAEIRAAASVRLLLELLRDHRYRYFGNESFLNAGAVRLGVRAYWRAATLPPPLDPADATRDLSAAQTEEIGRRAFVRRFQPVLDFLRANPRYVLSIGSRSSGPIRHRRLAQHFFEEVADRRITPSIRGVLLLGAAHASAARDADGATTRMLIEKGGYACVSIRIVTDFVSQQGLADDAVVPLRDAAQITTVDQVVQAGIQLTQLSVGNPVSVPTDRTFGNQASPFRRVAFAGSDRPVAEQFEHIVLQRA
jgi:hypothetical protein